MPVWAGARKSRSAIDEDCDVSQRQLDGLARMSRRADADPAERENQHVDRVEPVGLGLQDRHQFAQYGVSPLPDGALAIGHYRSSLDPSPYQLRPTQAERRGSLVDPRTHHTGVGTVSRRRGRREHCTSVRHGQVAPQRRAGRPLRRRPRLPDHSRQRRASAGCSPRRNGPRRQASCSVPASRIPESDADAHGECPVHGRTGSTRVLQKRHAIAQPIGRARVAGTRPP